MHVSKKENILPIFRSICENEEHQNEIVSPEIYAVCSRDHLHEDVKKLCLKNPGGNSVYDKASSRLRLNWVCITVSVWAKSCMQMINWSTINPLRENGV